MKTVFTTLILLGTLMASAQVTLISEDFEADTLGTLFTGAKFDYTKGAAFAQADTTPNTLGVYAGGGTSYNIVVDPLDAGNQALWLSGSDNPTNAGRGVYMMRLDPTAGGTYTSGIVTINYSFRMMRDGTNANSPTNFNVAWVSRTAVPVTLPADQLDMYSWTGETVVQSFETSGDSSEWVTVTGTITAAMSSLDMSSYYQTGIRVYATNGGFVTGSGLPGIYYVDDVSVTVEPVLSVILEDFEADAPGTLFTGAKFDYSKGGAFVTAESTPNIVGVYAGSGTSYNIVADPLDAGNQALWLTGSDNPTNPGRGVYMMRLDPTAGGTYTSGWVEIFYSFKMMRDGTNANSPTNFNIAWNSRRASLDDGTDNIDMFAWAGETNIQSFVTSGDSDTWVTVSGSFLAALEDLDTTSPYHTGIRVYATNGGFVSGSGVPGIYYVDDLAVGVRPVAGHPAFAFTQTVPVGGDLQIDWYGISGFTYQVESSIDLSEWIPIGSPQPGADAPMTHSEPNTNPVFLRVKYFAAP